MFTKWKNPLTDEYKELQDWIVNSIAMEWFYVPNNVDGPNVPGKFIPFYSHMIMQRPNRHNGKPYSEITSNLFENTYKVIQQIFDYNNTELNILYRININCVTANRVKQTPWHQDLEIPHKNFIIYLSEFTGGQTYLKKDTHEPKVDDIVVFEGEHCHAPPKKQNERRIVLVACYL
jgi:hypothetical protein